MIRIPTEEFEERVQRLTESMARASIDAVVIYGDEYRKENLRYVSNFWPLFERALCFVSLRRPPILAQAPEGEECAREMSVWQDIRNLKELECVTVAEPIEYPLSRYDTLEALTREALGGGRRLGVVGSGDIPATLFAKIKEAAAEAEIVPCDRLLADLRLIKSTSEIECLKEAGRIACVGYEKLMQVSRPGTREVEAAGAAEGSARMAGAEAIAFTIFASGERTNTIIGRPSARQIRDGDMVMAALAVQYQGYVSTIAYPFVAGRPSEAQKQFLRVLFDAAEIQRSYLRPGVPAADMVRAVQGVYRDHGLQEYDVYPPMHGIGLAEAESPYPNARSEYAFRAGMCVNSDISLFRHPVGSNRIEEGFVITEQGPVSLTPLVRALCGTSAAV